MAKKMNTLRSDGRYRVKVYLGIKDGKKSYKYVYGKTQKDGKQSFPSFLSKVKLETVLFLFCSVA